MRQAIAEHWTDTFLGVPFDECDCVALCGRVAEFLGVHQHLPAERPDASPWSYSRQLQKLMHDYVLPVVGDPREGDIALMKLRGRFCHVGVYCEPCGVKSILHTDQSHKSSVRIPIVRLRYRHIEIEGFYRWLG